VAVMVMLLPAFYGDYTSVGGLADYMLELNGRMVNVEVVMQPILHVAKNALAHGNRDISDGDVTGERVRLGPDAPDMQVVNVVHALDLSDD